jgi:hypothetical protein
MKPAPAVRPPSFPSLRLGWQLLGAASLFGAGAALADASLPDGRDAGKVPQAPRPNTPPHLKGEMVRVQPPSGGGTKVAPCPLPAGDRPTHRPVLRGKYKHVEPPAPPDGGSDGGSPDGGTTQTLLLHPHAPHEPCFEAAPPSRVA